MAKLILHLEGSVIGHQFLDKPRVTIGRASSNDIHLDETGISKKHAVIFCIGNDHIVEDLESTNGTLVNGDRITRHILQNGDVIQAGKYEFKYVNNKANPEIDFDKTMVMENSAWADLPNKADNKPVTILPVAARQVSGSFPLAKIFGLEGRFNGKYVELAAPLATFGKAGEQVVVVTRRPKGYFVIHVEGRKTGRLNGKAIGKEPRPLTHHDIIEVAGEKLEFLLQSQSK